MNMTTEAAMKLTIGEIVEHHYLPEKRARRRANTVYGYESSLNLHVLPRWGDVRICHHQHERYDNHVQQR